MFKYLLPLAIPLLLLSANLKKIASASGRLLGAFFLGSFCTVAGTVLAALLFPLTGNEWHVLFKHNGSVGTCMLHLLVQWLAWSAELLDSCTSCCGNVGLSCWQMSAAAVQQLPVRHTRWPMAWSTMLGVS